MSIIKPFDGVPARWEYRFQAGDNQLPAISPSTIDRKLQDNAAPPPR